MSKGDLADLARRLTGAMSLDTFNCEVRERHTQKFERAFDPVSTGNLFALSALEALLADDVVPPGYIDIVSEGLPRRLTNLQGDSGKSTLTLVEEALRSGATMRVSDIQRFDRRLGSFAREVASWFAARSQINIYVTPRGETGFNPHFDTTDIFILQCQGAKEWRVFADYTQRQDLPLWDTSWDPERYRPSLQYESHSLCEGDVLYIPRGAMHQAHCGDQPSMHLTISIAPLTLHEAIIREFKRMAGTDICLRKRLAWSVDSDAHEVARLNDEVRKRLIELSEQVDLAKLLKSEASLIQSPSAVARTGRLGEAITSSRSKDEN